jgi:dihydroorotate dehydrogenase (fumarate)
MEFRENVCLGMRHPLSLPLMNGGGCCKTLEDVRELSRTLAGAVLVGSITIEQRLGNPGDVWWVGDGVALNSLGMPNGGWEYLRKNLPEMAGIAHGEGKALVVNVAGFDPQEYRRLTGLAFDFGTDVVELNLGCPNVVKDDGSRKPIASFNLEVMEEIVSCVEQEVGKYTPIWVKVSPYSDPELLKGAAAVLLRHPIVKAVTAINTFPSAYESNDSGKSVIDAGLAGMSGQALKPIGLGQVKQWNRALAGKIDLIGVGGISTGSDINKYRILGAQAFQMTTELLKSGKLDPRPFEKVAAGYLEIAA